MSFPIQITAKDLPNRGPIDVLIHERAERLERFQTRIISARVTIDVEGAHPARHHFKLQIAIPGAEIVVDHGPTDDLAHAIREGFDVARRQLEDRAPHPHHHLSDRR